MMKPSMVAHLGLAYPRVRGLSNQIRRITAWFESQGIQVRPRPEPTGAVPLGWYNYHHRNCGTLYPGCDPKRCPRDVYERTGKWIGM